MVRKKNINFRAQKRKKAENDFEKGFFKLINNGAFCKFLENVRNRLIIDVIKNWEYRKILKQQSRLTLNGVHKPYTN